MRTLGYLAIAALLGFVSGCNKTEAPKITPPKEKTSAGTAEQELLPSGTVLRLHSIGKNRILTLPATTRFQKMLATPESSRLEAQILDKLSTLPTRLLTHETNALSTNAVSQLLRPLLNDWVNEESFLEILGEGSEPKTLLLGIRLGVEQAGLWQTNVYAAVKSLPPVRASITRMGDWTLIGFFLGGGAGNDTLAKFGERVQRGLGSPADIWVESTFNVPQLAPGLVSLLGTSNLPIAHLTIGPDHENLKTGIEAFFPKPLSVLMEDWAVPTNMLQDSSISFTAARGFAQFLSSVPFYKRLDLGECPNQIFFWAKTNQPLQTSLAIPLHDPAAVMQKFSSLLVAQNAWLRTNATGSFENGTNLLAWRGLPLMTPNVFCATNQGQAFLIGRLLMDRVATNQPPPVSLLKTLNSRTNLVYGDWEDTGSRIDDWLYTSQLFRVLMNKPQVPAKSTSIAWIKAINDLLATSATGISLEPPNRFSLVRKSSMGLTAPEIQLCLDWFESPNFPLGLHSFSRPERKPLGTTSPAQPH